MFQDLLPHIATRTQQRVGLQQLPILNAERDLTKIFVQQIVVEFRIPGGHIGDELFIILLFGIEFLQRLTVLLFRDLVVLLERIDLLFPLLQFHLELASQLPLGRQLVVSLPLRRLHCDDQRVGRTDVLLLQHIGIGQHIALLLDIGQIELLVGHRQREVAIGIGHGRVSAGQLDGSTGDALSGDQLSTAVYPPFSLHITLLGGLRGEERDSKKEDGGDKTSHDYYLLQRDG